MKIVSTVEARMTSSRLPGKVLMPILGKPVLELLIERLKRVPEVDQIVMATTVNPDDNPIAELAERLEIGVFRGSEEDVLQRVIDAGETYGADIMVEITGDCPLIDPKIISQVITMYLDGSYDYVTNDYPYTFPLGLDLHVFSLASLKNVAEITADPLAHEHVTYYFREHPEKYRIGNFEAPSELHHPKWRLTMDYQEDYELIKAIYEALYQTNPTFSAYDIANLLHERPDLTEINAGRNIDHQKHLTITKK